jgi:enoyl-CoA hydratase
MPDQFADLTVSIEDKVAYITLHRPDKSNALSQRLWHEIGDAFRWADQTPEVRCVVLSGAGKNFCAGIDFALIQQLGASIEPLSEGRKQETMRQTIKELQACFTAVEECRKPVLAAVHGACFGAGIDLIAACDMRYATRDSMMSVKEVDLGIVADIGTLQRLPRIVAEGVARELALTARSFQGMEAKEFGLVNQVYATQEELLEQVDQVARSIARKSPLAIRGTKQIMNYSRDHSVAEGLDYVATWNAGMLMSTDLQKSVEAAMSKMLPEFED